MLSAVNGGSGKHGERGILLRSTEQWWGICTRLSPGEMIESVRGLRLCSVLCP